MAGRPGVPDVPAVASPVWPSGLPGGVVLQPASTSSSAAMASAAGAPPLGLRAGLVGRTPDNRGMWIIVLEAVGAGLLLVFIVWWTMFSGRRGGERRDDDPPT